MKTTRYFEAMRARPDRAVIKDEWIVSVIERPEMKIKYFQDTDTLHIEFRQAPIAETRDLDENTLLDLDAAGNICGITVEHARERADIPQFSFEQIGV
jgi:uncharacterized protein YuzE